MSKKPDTPACVVNCAVYRDGRREDISLDQISDMLAVDDGSFVWVGLYEPDATLLEAQYDFVTCTEVVEHFRDPLAGWTQLAALVRPGGWLGVMTQLAPALPANFLRWRYRDDRTHVSFHRLATLQWLAVRFGFALEQVESQAFLLHRQG